MRRLMLMTGGVALVIATIWTINGSRSNAAPSSSPATAAAPTADTRVVAALGRVEPLSEEILIGAELPGRLAQVHVDEGDRVARGAILAELDNADFHARVSAAHARLASALAEEARLVNGARGEERREAEAQRQQAETSWAQADNEHRRRASLYANGAIALEEAERAERDARFARARLDEATERARLVAADARTDDLARMRAAVALARASLDEARALLAKTIIRAPHDATVISRHRREGELVSPETGAILTLADTSRLRVRAEVDETDVARLSVGQGAWLRADAYGAQRFSGRVSRVGLALGQKLVRTDRPGERRDTAVLEALVDLDPGVFLPIGLRVDVFIIGEQ